MRYAAYIRPRRERNVVLWDDAFGWFGFTLACMSYYRQIIEEFKDTGCMRIMISIILS